MKKLKNFLPLAKCSATLARLDGHQLSSRSGEVSERLKEHAWKVCIRETVSRVRIPPSPPDPYKAPSSGALSFPGQAKCPSLIALAPQLPPDAPRLVPPGPAFPLPLDVPIPPAGAPPADPAFPFAPLRGLDSPGVPVVVDVPGPVVEIPGPVVVIGESSAPGWAGSGSPTGSLLNPGVAPDCCGEAARGPMARFDGTAPVSGACSAWRAASGSRMALIPRPVSRLSASIRAPMRSRSCWSVRPSSCAAARGGNNGQ